MNYETKSLVVYIKNVGLGPAEFTRFRHTVDSVEFLELDRPQIQQIKEDAGITRMVGDRFPAKLNPGTVIAPGEQIPIVAFKAIEGPDTLDLNAFAHRFNARIHYCSIYGEEFLYG